MAGWLLEANSDCDTQEDEEEEEEELPGRYFPLINLNRLLSRHSSSAFWLPACSGAAAASVPPPVTGMALKRCHYKFISELCNTHSFGIFYYERIFNCTCNCRVQEERRSLAATTKGTN